MGKTPWYLPSKAFKRIEKSSSSEKETLINDNHKQFSGNVFLFLKDSSDDFPHLHCMSEYSVHFHYKQYNCRTNIPKPIINVVFPLSSFNGNISKLNVCYSQPTFQKVSLSVSSYMLELMPRYYKIREDKQFHTSLLNNTDFKWFYTVLFLVN